MAFRSEFRNMFRYKQVEWSCNVQSVFLRSWGLVFPASLQILQELEVHEDQLKYNFLLVNIILFRRQTVKF